LTSGELERERPGSDELKEIQEMMGRVVTNLFPLSTPSWPDIDMGIARAKGSAQGSFYYDFFHLPNNTFLILLASSTVSTLESSIHIATLRGMIRMHLHGISPTMNTPLNIPSFLELINRMLSEDNLKSQFALSLLLLDPLNNMLTYTSCDASALLHIPQGSTQPRELHSHNALLGASINSTFSEINDNWNPEDILIMNSFVLPWDISSEQRSSFEATLKQADVENLLLAAQRQAELILKKTSLSPAFSFIRSPKAVISIQRIV
jgi:serine phosphatase RsbU (regulator of sigma subunit)